MKCLLAKTCKKNMRTWKHAIRNWRYFAFMTLHGTQRAGWYLVTNFIDLLQEEHDTFRDLADKMIEEKDAEISRLLEDNKHLRQSHNSKPMVCLFACYWATSIYYVFSKVFFSLPFRLSFLFHVFILWWCLCLSQADQDSSYDTGMRISCTFQHLLV